MAKTQTEAPPAEQPTNGDGPVLAATQELAELRQRARAAIGGEYKGELTAQNLDALQELLYEPIPERFIETIGELPGKPYVSTGIRSLQVQVDRMNAIVGPSHWRLLTRYEAQGTICKAVVVIGNKLHLAYVDENGDLVANDADILAVVEGWGGHKARQAGDSYKGSETNAAKRAIARCGPGAAVYAQDFDDHPAAVEQHAMPPVQGAPMAQPPVPQPQPVQAPAQAAPVQGDPQRGQPMTEEMAQQHLDALLAQQDEHTALRQQANQAMLDLPQTPPAVLRFQLIKARENDARQLQALIERADVTAANA